MEGLSFFENFDADSDFEEYSSGGKTDSFRESIQTIFSTLIKSGWRYNIHLVLALKGDPSTWRGGRIVSDVNQVVLFNSTDYTDQFDNQYYLKEMLKNNYNDGEDETMAVWANHKTYSKIRPIIYSMSNTKEKNAVDLLLGGETR